MTDKSLGKNRTNKSLAEGHSLTNKCLAEGNFLTNKSLAEDNFLTKKQARFQESRWSIQGHTRRKQFHKKY